MIKKATPAQKLRVLEMLEEGSDRDAIASAVGITPAQVSAVAAHKTMGTYSKSKVIPNESLNHPTSALPEGSLTGDDSERGEKAGSNDGSYPNSIWLGTDSRTNDSVFWNPDPEYGSANPHVLIIGESGFGKTYTTACLVSELAQQDIPSVIFDYGQGFGSSSAPRPFRKWANASEFELNKDGIAINPLEIFSVDLHGPATVAQRVADTFERVYPRLGVQQHSVIRRAVLELLSEGGISRYDRNTWTIKVPHFRNLERKLEQYVGDSGTSQRRIALSAASHVSSLFIFDTFRSNGQKLSWNDFLSNRKEVWVLQLGGLESSVERVVTEFLLWNLIRFVESQGPGPLRCLVVLDEAHKLSFSPGSPVEKLLREGRKFGLGVILASQQPEDFSPVAFANTATKLVFQVADERGAVAKRLHRKDKTMTPLATVENTITKLPKGWAYVVTGNVGRVVRIASFEDRIPHWQRALQSRKALID